MGVEQCVRVEGEVGGGREGVGRRVEHSCVGIVDAVLHVVGGTVGSVVLHGVRVGVVVDGGGGGNVVSQRGHGGGGGGGARHLRLLQQWRLKPSP